MTTGTVIIQKALTLINAHSVIAPANSESIEAAMGTLNSMISGWEDDRILMGAMPLSAPGDELSEPLGARNAIEFCLAVELQPMFPGAQISQQTMISARKGLTKLKRNWRTTTIPKPIARRTLPKGQGNKRYLFEDVFFVEGSEIG